MIAYQNAIYRGGLKMKLQECYERFGGDYNDAVSRMMNDSLIEKFVLKFPNDKTMDQLKEAVAANNTEDTFRAAHTLKGIAGNLSFTGLESAASKLTEQLRGKTDETPDPVLVARTESEYDRVINAINAYIAEK